MMLVNKKKINSIKYHIESWIYTIYRKEQQNGVK
jgi:hypothetical protein